MSAGVSSPFLISSPTNLSDENPNVTALADGGFLVTWQGVASADNTSEIFVQRYGALRSDGTSPKIGPILQVSSSTNGADFSPSVTGLTDGGFLVTWQGFDPASDTIEIYVQRYGAPGPGGTAAKVGSTIKVTENEEFNGSGSEPGVTTLADGSFLVSWTSASDIVVQRYGVPGPDGSPTKVGNLINVSTYEGRDDSSSVTALADGGFLVSWTARGQRFDVVQAQRYGAPGPDGTPTEVGPNFRISDGFGSNPSVTALADGGFVVSWTSQDPVSFIPEILAQRYGAPGLDDVSVKVGPVIQVSSSTNDGNDRFPSVAALPDGGFVVSWTVSDPTGETSEVLAQRYGTVGSDGVSPKVGNLVLVSSPTNGADFDPSVTALANGGFLVSWAGLNPASGTVEILARQFGPADALEPPVSGSPVTYVVGTNANETFTGDARNNYLNGGGGQDTTIGGLGDDTYVVDIPSDVVVESLNAGIDTVESYASSYVLSANVENLILKGVGQSGTGNGFANLLIGGTGNDVLNGMAGHDYLTGGAGADTFVFERGTGKDVIADFVTSGSAHDVVDLTSFDYASFSRVQAALAQAGSDTLLSLSDGSQVIFLNHTVSQFTAGDFVL